MRRSLWIAVVLMTVACGRVASRPQVSVTVDGVPFVEMRAERLPDLRQARTGHALVRMGDGWMAAGGHTTGFVPVEDAEIRRGGREESVRMLYPHDNPFALTLKDGRIVLGGGYAESFGIGQSWGVECYDPASGRFAPMPIMDRKRALPSAVELSGGKIALSGNWWADDDLELFTPGGLFRKQKDVSRPRCYPFILRSDIDNAIVFGGLSPYCEPQDPWVDRLYGDAFEVPLLQAWRPFININHGPIADDCFIGDMSTGHFSYLVHVLDSLGQPAVMLVSGETFTLLETDRPIPVEGVSGRITYCGYIRTDRFSRTAWLLGVDEGRRAYLAEIGYGKTSSGSKATLLMHFTPEALEDLPQYPADLLLADGSVLLAGGVSESNYEPSAAVYRLYPGAAPVRQPWWPFIAACILLLAVLAFFLLRRSPESPAQAPAPEPAAPDPAPDMMTRITALMEEKELFRRKDLRLSDIAFELATNTTYVSACINGQTGGSFPDFVAQYRVRYAQELMRSEPDLLLSEVGSRSGFANDKSFFRTFKARTGLTPSEWKAKL